VTGRVWAYIGAVLGAAVSIAANVLHSYVPAPDVPAGWTPPAGAVVGAVFWPIALLVAVEILARVAWPPGWRWTALRFLGLVPVAVVAAVVSYRHMAGLLAFYREDPLTVAIGPLAVDGLMVMAAGALIATGRARRAEVAPVALPPVPPASAQVGGPDAAPVVPPVDEPAPPEVRRVQTSRKAAAAAPSRRPFAVTQRAAAALQADGMDVAGIAAALNITTRQARAALKPVAVDPGGDR
jgi:hypothetical protein